MSPSDSSLDTSSYEAFVPERPGGSLRLLLNSPEAMAELGRELGLLFVDQARIEARIEAHPPNQAPSLAQAPPPSPSWARAQKQPGRQSPGGAGLPSDRQVRTILLHGQLGAGKTTFTRGFVAALPGSDQAEVSSPSFTICNMYPTQPPVLHCDLYRSAGLQPDGTLRFLPDEVEEAFDADEGLLLVEWAERVPTFAKPPERLDIFFQVCQNERSALLIPYGSAARAMLDALDRNKAKYAAMQPGRP